MKPKNVDSVTDVKDLLPDYDKIPDEFKGASTHSWVEWQRIWFFKGLNAVPEPKEGIDKVKAMHHLAFIQKSFGIKHEVKESSVAYLASLWFKEPVYGEEN